MLPAAPKIIYDEKFKSPQSLVGGQKYTLDAKVTGIPAPKTTWFFKGQSLTATQDLAVEATATVGKLVFSKAKFEHSGVYLLKAENSVGSDEVEFTLAIKGLPASFGLN